MIPLNSGIYRAYAYALNDTQNVDYTDVFEDVSEENLQSAVRGKVLECSNHGAVSADRNAGGIAGAMAIEYDLDPEDDLLSTENRSVRFTWQTRAILLDCDNYGSVQMKKSCTGGVAGRMDLGTVSGCGSWGSIASESGDYVGGTAGLSLPSIRSSYAKCTLSGGRYVGGIAGSGSRISDCVSMVEITDCTQFGGAIAGEVTGQYSGNRFVSDTLAGIDRVSYAGKAEQISYDQLRTLEGIPDDFLHLTQSFVADGKTLKTEHFDYGDSFTDAVYPEAPEKEGFYVRWDRTDLRGLQFDTVVTAVYEPYVTTLASEAARDGHAAVLAEGQFRAGDRLQAVMETEAVSAPGSAAEVWTLRIPDDGQQTHTVRWRLPAEGKDACTVYTNYGDGWKKVRSEQVGSYLCFDMTGSGRFAVASAARTAWWAAVLAFMAGGAILTVCWRGRKKRARQTFPVRG